MNRAKPFTGRHISAILIIFFAIVIAVNVTMATIAVKGFGGTVVDNSYVASQEFNGWLRKARAQTALGWHETIGIDAGRHLTLAPRGADGRPIAGATIRAIALHPLGRAPDIRLTFVQVAPGRYRSIRAVPVGRWTVHWTIDAAGHEKRFVEDVH